MQNVWKIFFKNPLRADSRGLTENGVIIYIEAIQESDLRNNGFTLRSDWYPKSAGDNIWLLKDGDKDLRMIISKTRIEKMELSFN